MKFNVEEGLSAEGIADTLADAGVLSDARRFRVLLNFGGGGSELQAGCYTFSPRTPAAEVLRRLRTGATAGASLVIPEGLRNEEVGERVTKAGIGNIEEWNAALAKVRPKNPALAPPERAPLLGYLLPASYPIECRVNAEQFVGAMLDAFEAQVTPELLADAQRAGLTLHQVLTLASIVEREAVHKEEQPIVASVFLNRLRERIPLQADPTVQFAIATPETASRFGWWKQELTVDDLGHDSPYNTYEARGLPPGPIANPGIDAIKAVIRPARTEYLYFVARGDGSHVFSRTLDEHNVNVERLRERERQEEQQRR